MTGSAYSASDMLFMSQAISLANDAALAGEVPVGAVIVKQDVIIGRGFNQPIKTNDSSAHAEICLLYTSPSPRDRTRSRMPSSA